MRVGFVTQAEACERLIVGFKAPLTPIGKARPRFTRWGGVYTPPATHMAERKLALACRQALSDFVKPSDAPIRIAIRACFAIPSSASQKKRAAMLGQPVTKKPDADNIAKLVLDALNGIAYTDDKQVFSVSVEKRYALEDSMAIDVLETLLS